MARPGGWRLGGTPAAAAAEQSPVLAATVHVARHTARPLPKHRAGVGPGSLTETSARGAPESPPSQLPSFPSTAVLWAWGWEGADRLVFPCLLCSIHPLARRISWNRTQACWDSAEQAWSRPELGCQTTEEMQVLCSRFKLVALSPCSGNNVSAVKLALHHEQNKRTTCFDI